MGAPEPPRQPFPCTFCGQEFTGPDMIDHLNEHYEDDDVTPDPLARHRWTPEALDRLLAMLREPEDHGQDTDEGGEE